jgi:hypothetical protein
VTLESRTTKGDAVQKRLVLTLLLGAALGLALNNRALAADIPLPEFYGIYIIADGKLYSLDTPDSNLDKLRQPIAIGHAETDFKRAGGQVLSVPVLPPAVSILVFAKGNPLAVAERMKLVALPFVRQMTINPSTNSRQTWNPNSWVAGKDFGYVGLGETTIELRFKPVKGQDEMVLAVPSSPLDPGVYGLSGFFFSVGSLERAAAARCIDAVGGAFEAWRLSPCLGPAEASAVNTAPANDARDTAIGFVVTGNDVPVFSGPKGSGATTKLPQGALAANAKGTYLDPSWAYELEEANGRTHIVYLREGKIRAGWVASEMLQQFPYDCSCAPACDPIQRSPQAEWNPCFQKAQQSKP